jgi:hypothetical protein
MSGLPKLLSQHREFLQLSETTAPLSYISIFRKVRSRKSSHLVSKMSEQGIQASRQRFVRCLSDHFDIQNCSYEAKSIPIDVHDRAASFCEENRAEYH